VVAVDGGEGLAGGVVVASVERDGGGGEGDLLRGPAAEQRPLHLGLGGLGGVDVAAGVVGQGDDAQGLLVGAGESASRCSRRRAPAWALVVSEALAARAGGLVRVPLPTPPLPEGVVYLVAHRALRPVPRIAALWEWLIDEFEALEREGLRL